MYCLNIFVFWFLGLGILKHYNSILEIGDYASYDPDRDKTLGETYLWFYVWN